MKVLATSQQVSILATIKRSLLMSTTLGKTTLGKTCGRRNLMNPKSRVNMKPGSNAMRRCSSRRQAEGPIRQVLRLRDGRQVEVGNVFKVHVVQCPQFCLPTDGAGCDGKINFAPAGPAERTVEFRAQCGFLRSKRNSGFIGE